MYTATSCTAAGPTLPTMLSLNDLEPEIVSLILEFIDDTSPRSTKAVACVNKYLNEITKQIAHRHKTIDVSGSLDLEGRVVKTIKSWIRNANILANIRTLTVKGRFEVALGNADTESEGDDDDDDQDDDDDIDPAQTDELPWAPVVDLVSKIGRLRHLDWNVEHSMPISLLDAIERHQRFAKLRIWNYTRVSVRSQSPEEIELRLAQSAALTHIRMAATTFHLDEDIRELAFRCIVGSAPNLEYAGLVRHSIVNWSQWQGLDLHKPSFYINSKPNAAIRQLTLDGCEISKRTLEDWSSVVDLSSLRNIKFSRGMPTLDYFQYAANVMPHLEHISLNLRYIKDMSSGQEKLELVTAAQDYIRTCSPLRTLSLWSWAGIIPLADVLQRHGPNLRSLQLHERELIVEKGTRETLSVNDVRSIRTNCPNLRELTIDLTRGQARLNLEKDTNKPYYDELASFKHLEFLQIYLDVGASFLLHQATYNYSAVALAEFYSFTQHSTDDDNDDDENAIGSASNANAQNAGPSTKHSTTTASSSSPPSPPHTRPAKKQRVNPDTRPSRDRYLIPYAKNIWTIVFGEKVGGRRHLDVKVGEWEGSNNVGAGRGELACKRHLQVRPHERDDVFEPTVKVHRKREYH